jgi:4-amino-4-deoxy-L-arabinose transferase-like glycosyltransferase
MPPGPRGGPDAAVSDALISYLQQNQGAATYLVATQNSHTAASIILGTNEPVMSLGGFTGSDPILTVDEFAALVDAGELRYVLLGGGGPGSRGSNGGITTWVQASGTPVHAASLGGSQSQLYDLAGRAPT